jgi:hypothetical protein
MSSSGISIALAENDDDEAGGQASQGSETTSTSADLEGRCVTLLVEVVTAIRQWAGEERTMLDAELRLFPMVFALGRALLALYVAAADEVLSQKMTSVIRRGRARYVQRPRQRRTLGTVFGRIRYWRGYWYNESRGSGIHPLDEKLGLSNDGFTLNVVSLATRLATKLPFETAAELFKCFLGWAPATKTIEEWVLGLGERAQRFQEQAPPPPGDGEVLGCQIDSKGVPTATEPELRKRRGPRRPNPHPDSKRHRGRAKRRRLGGRPRRRKGDKSKNARMCTLVVMYTLTRAFVDGKSVLLGPKNVRVHASFAPKKRAFEVARREAIKRGFGPESGKTIQFVNDGDDDLEVYRRQYFGDYAPGTIVSTADNPHVMEYIWTAGTALYAEGSDELQAWAKKQKRRLFDSRSDLVIADLNREYALIPKQGPGNKGRRERLEKAIGYLEANNERMDYKAVIQQDLDLASGIVEGAVNHVAGARFDHGGMRWIRERAEPLLQLRCIEINGDWGAFIQWVHRDLTQQPENLRRIARSSPGNLPHVDIAQNTSKKAA